MNLAHDWPLIAGFATIALALGMIAGLPLRGAEVFGTYKQAVFGLAVAAPPTIILIGVLGSWQPGQSHSGNDVAEVPVFFLAMAGAGSSLATAFLCWTAEPRRPVAQLFGVLASLALIPLAALALLGAGEAIAGASL